MFKKKKLKTVKEPRKDKKIKNINALSPGVGAKKKKFTRKKKRNFIIGSLVLLVLFINIGVFVSHKIDEYKEQKLKEKFGNMIDIDAEKENQDDKGNVIEEKNNCSLYIIDTGLGEAVLLDNGEYEALIDAGTEKSYPKLKKVLSKYVDGELECVINTNISDKRVGGLPKLAKDFKVGNIIYSRIPGSSDSISAKKSFNVFIDEGEKQGSNIIIAENENIDMGKGVSIATYSLNSDKDKDGKILACKISLGNSKALILSDSDEKRENLLSGKVEDIDILIAGKHGGAGTLSPKMLSVLSPKFIVFSSSAPSDNGEKYPDKKVFERALEATNNIYSTYRHKTISFLMEKDSVLSLFESSKKTEPLKIESYKTVNPSKE